MRIHVTARHCELDPEDRLLAEQRIEKLSRFVRDIQEAHVTVSQAASGAPSASAVADCGAGAPATVIVTSPRIATP